MTIRIPEEDKVALRKLGTLSEEDIDFIADSVDTNSPLVFLQLQDLSKKLSQRTGMESLEAWNIYKALFAAAASNGKVEVEEIARSAAGSADEEKSIVAVLNKLILGESKIESLTSASDSAMKHGLLVVDSELITNIRPIYNKKDKKSLEFNIVYHELKLSYLESDEEFHRYFSINYKALRDLKKAIELAIEREEALLEASREEFRILASK